MNLTEVKEMEKKSLHIHPIIVKLEYSRTLYYSLISVQAQFGYEHVEQTLHLV